jgi:hypothetical protein
MTTSFDLNYFDFIVMTEKCPAAPLEMCDVCTLTGQTATNAFAVNGLNICQGPRL